MTPIEPWRRTSFQSGGAQNVFQLFVFSPVALKGDIDFSGSRFGLPSKDAMAFVEVRELPRDVDSAWFDGFRSGSLRGLATEALHGDIALLDAATQLTAVMVARADADDLTHLQAGWAVTQWLIARGATVVLDAQTNRFWRGADIAAWPAGRPFTLTSDVNIVVEAEPTSPTANIHTRGLQKFGRPDLVVRDAPGERWDAIAGLVRVVAAMLVDGMIIRPGDSKTIDGQTIMFKEWNNDDLHLNNVALELTA